MSFHFAAHHGIFWHEDHTDREPGDTSRLNLQRVIFVIWMTVFLFSCLFFFKYQVPKRYKN
ncbi:MAG TPA: hypothetical protein DD452_06085 [Nitrospina sp.]|nr:hypothetical protein [Nitrospina sp.]